MSVAIYVAGRGRVDAASSGWTFNPFAWQLLFTIGVIGAMKWRSGLPRPQGRLIALALAVILGAAILSIRAIGLKPTAFVYLDLDKTNLGLMRLAHFLALAYVMSTIAIVQPWATRMSMIMGSRVGHSLQGMGRKSLLFFALGSVASTGGRNLMAAMKSLGAPHLFLHVIVLGYTAASVIVMFAIVKRMNRTASLPRLSTDSRDTAVPVNPLRSDARESVAFP
jgi:hypothetical protein